MEIHVEAITAPVGLGEGPHWDVEQQVLYYVSIYDQTIHRWNPATHTETSTKIPDGTVGFIVPVAGKPNHFVVGISRKIVIIKWDEKQDSVVETVKVIAEVDEGLLQNRINDGKADPVGRIFAGTFCESKLTGAFSDPNKGSLYVFDKNGSKRILSGVNLSNGLAWNTNENKFYYNDSTKYTLCVYDYSVATGEIGNEKVLLDFKASKIEGLPDGLTIDTDGNLWVACYSAGQVIKVDPVTGDILQVIKVPAANTTSVAFGGKYLDELFVTSAAGNDTNKDAGRTFRVTGLGVRGFPAQNYLE